ncbi:intraflagellar transport protein 46-like protein [Plakobranchus ocellatus]|uniref:Intraflagellar transport protein 46 homolog n=1 Tax=Plakobranchus ocellatus TaxID=259542 RepID=A0AAV4CP54_9GAST|nr:intraflagellar transport protein 46-like protein [Plakobranchus ocellatus]
MPYVTLFDSLNKPEVQAREALGVRPQARTRKAGKGGMGRLSRGDSPPDSNEGDPSDQSDDLYEDSTLGAAGGGGPGMQGGQFSDNNNGPQAQPRGGNQEPTQLSTAPKQGQQFNSDEDDETLNNVGIPRIVHWEEFQKYTPQAIELDHKLKPFIPDYIPAVGDIDAFIKIARPDSKPDTLGLTVLDEPCAKQSDPTVLDLQLRAISKQTTAKQLVVKSLANAEKNPKHIENWIDNIRELHRSKPPPNVHYSKNMPEIDTLMQEWPPEFEQLLKEVGLPTAELDCDLGEYVEIIASILDIPVYKNSAHHNEKIQALHVLFTLYSEFKNSQHFRSLAEENKLDNALKEDQADRFVL